MPRPPWTDTVWYRLPAKLARPGVSRLLGLAVALAGAIPSMACLVWARALIPYMVQNVMELGAQDPFASTIIAGMEPARRAGLPARMEQAITQYLPGVAVAGLVVAVGTGLAIVVGGILLTRTLGDGSVPVAPVGRSGPSAGEPAGRRTSALVFLIGMVAHLHSLLQGASPDECGAALHAAGRWWAFADTRFGWQTHIGGEMLAAIGMGLFGHTAPAARLPGTICASIGLALTFAWVHRHAGRVPAILTTGLLCVLPMWAEETGMVRGYGLMFLGGSLVIPALWDVLDGAAGSESTTLARLFAGSLLGFLAHFFFAFLLGACLLLLGRRAVFGKDPLSAAGVVWIVAGVVLPALIYLPGFPSAVSANTSGTWASVWNLVPPRFVEEAGFGLAPPARWVGSAALLALTLEGLRRLERTERRRVLFVALLTTFVPLATRPLFYYPRFFVSLLPLLFVATLPVAAALSAIRAGRLRVGAAVAVCVALVLTIRPWRRQPILDWPAASAAVARLTRPGDAVYIDRFFIGVKSLYFHDMATSFIAIDHGIPPAARVVVTAANVSEPARSYPGFRLVDRIPGREMDLLTYVAERAAPAAAASSHD